MAFEEDIHSSRSQRIANSYAEFISQNNLTTCLHMGGPSEAMSRAPFRLEAGDRGNGPSYRLRDWTSRASVSEIGSAFVGT